MDLGSNMELLAIGIGVLEHGSINKKFFQDLKEIGREEYEDAI